MQLLLLLVGGAGQLVLSLLPLLSLMRDWGWHAKGGEQLSDWLIASLAQCFIALNITLSEAWLITGGELLTERGRAALLRGAACRRWRKSVSSILH